MGQGHMCQVTETDFKEPILLACATYRLLSDNLHLSEFLKMQVHPYKLFSCLRFGLLLAILFIVWTLNSSWKREKIFVVDVDRRFLILSEGRYEYRMQQTLNKTYYKIWEKCSQTINEESIYKPTTDVKEVIDALRHAKIVKADLYSSRTSSAYKWMLILEGGQQVLFKPALTNKTVKESAKCVSGCEHPEYEVAGFALNRLFRLGNMPYATGRRVSWNQEISSVATEGLRKSVTVQEDGDVCIKWRCYLKPRSRYCFEKGVIYGAVIYWIKVGTVLQRANKKGSWHHEFHAMGGYLENFSAILPGNRRYCDRFRGREPYKSDTVSFVHILDMAAIDFLLLNYDGGKHTYIATGNKTIYLNIMIDYGMSFCNRDDPVLLAPIYQCCSIRKNLYKSLLKYSANLTEVFYDATKDDPLFPLLLPRDITAMHQRLKTIFALVQGSEYRKKERNV